MNDTNLLSKCVSIMPTKGVRIHAKYTLSIPYIKILPFLAPRF